MSDDPNSERVYNPDGWGCGFLIAVVALTLLLLLAVPAVAAALT
ncbi:hypothetical protein [Micromonospora sp. RV43]|nr:hypothetical protein [Micromonospora sp. RV43]